MADTNNFVVKKKFGVEAENSGIEELKSNSESDWQESEWIRKIQSYLKARSGQNAEGDVPILKLPASLRKPVEHYTPRQWQFGLHNRDPQASSSESEILKIRLAARKLNSDEWDKFCADFVDNPADMMLKSYGIHSSETELSPKEVQYALTLDALTLVLALSSASAASEPEPDDHSLPYNFGLLLVEGGFDIVGFWCNRNRAAQCWFFHDLFLCENQIPMALMKKAINKCYGLLPEERKSDFPELRELENSDSNVTKKLLDTILKFVASKMCCKFFADPFALLNLIFDNYEVGMLGDCAHLFGCIHKVMTSCVEPATDKKSSGTDTELFAPGVNQQLETDEEALATVGTPPIAVFKRAKQLFSSAVATGSEQLANVIVTIFGFSTETVTEKFYFRAVIPSATDLKKAGLQIQGIPGMVQQVAFKNGCLFLPIMAQSEITESYICNMAAYEFWSTSGPFAFMNYMLLMAQLIKTPEDLSCLVDCNVIWTSLGTQQRIFQMWERLQSKLWFPAFSDEYLENIVEPINTHCASALNVMRTDFYNTFCSKPWLVISVISAIILLVATLIQTYVAVIGSDKMQPHFPRGG